MLRILCAGAIVALSLGTAQARDVPAKQARRYLAEYADCVVANKRFADKVQTFLRTTPDNKDYANRAIRAADMHCLDAAAERTLRSLEMKIKPDTYRDALWAALYRRDYGKAPVPANLAQLSPLAYAREYDGDVAGLPVDWLARRGFGDCVARTAPQGVHDLLMSEIGSEAEDAAVAAIAPDLGQCVMKGQSLRLGRDSLRRDLAEAMYKLTAAASAAPAAAP